MAKALAVVGSLNNMMTVKVDSDGNLMVNYAVPVSQAREWRNERSSCRAVQKYYDYKINAISTKGMLCCRCCR